MPSDLSTLAQTTEKRVPAAIAPRALRFSWGADLPRFWFGGDAFRTHYMNALSLLFPQGEQFFIETVRALRHASRDATLDAEIGAFIGQESWHRQAHLAYNAHLEAQGLPVARLEARLRSRIEFVRTRMTPLRGLAATVCLEHFTAILAHHLLSRPQELETMPLPLRRLWLWHALEELEHKSVAFDLYRAAGGGAALRSGQMLIVTFTFTLDVLGNLAALLAADGLLWKRAVWASGAGFLFGPRRGLVWSVLPAYLGFFRPGFHPRDTDEGQLIASARFALSRLSAPH